MVITCAQVTWSRVNYEHRDGSRLKLNVREVTSDTLIASVTQSELDPAGTGPGVADLVQRLQLFKDEFSP